MQDNSLINYRLSKTLNHFYLVILRLLILCFFKFPLTILTTNKKFLAFLPTSNTTISFSILKSAKHFLFYTKLPEKSSMNINFIITNRLYIATFSNFIF